MSPVVAVQGTPLPNEAFSTRIFVLCVIMQHTCDVSLLSPLCITVAVLSLLFLVIAFCHAAMATESELHVAEKQALLAMSSSQEAIVAAVKRKVVDSTSSPLLFPLNCPHSFMSSPLSPIKSSTYCSAKSETGTDMNLSGLCLGDEVGCRSEAAGRI